MSGSSELRPPHLGHVECQVAVSSTPGLKPPPDHSLPRRPWAVPGSSWWFGQPARQGDPRPSAPPLPPAVPPRHQPPPYAQHLPAKSRGCQCTRAAWIAAGAAAGVGLLAGLIVFIVLRKQHAAAAGGADAAYSPLPYYQREYNTSAQPAFAASLHPLLLPKEQAAVGLSLDVDVIIVGAGIAGLRAAQILAANMSVLILEARDRVGGRIQSLQFGAVTAEMGAQYIWGSESGIDGGGGNPLTQLANIAGLTRVAAAAEGSQQQSFGADGRQLSAGALTSLQRWSGDLLALASAADTNQSLADVLRQPQMLARVGGTPANLVLLSAAAQARYGLRYGGQLAQLSAAYFNNETSFSGNDNIVLGGYSSIPQSLAAWLAGNANAQLRLSTPVAGVQHGDSNATVYTWGGEALTAQYVICTAPLGVLQAGTVQLEPPLPEEGAAALGRLGVGRLEKLWMEFDTAFWSDSLCGAGEAAAPCEQVAYLAPAGNTSGWRRFISMTAYTGQPVIVALASAAWAEQLTGVSDAEALLSALADLATLFPAAATARLVQHQLSRWGEDPWALGSLSYYAVGSSPADRATLAEPQSGSLILAGEATSVLYPGTVHGAYLAGQLAAYRVLDAASDLPQCGSSSGDARGIDDGGTCVAPAANSTPEDMPDCTCEWPALLSL